MQNIPVAAIEIGRGIEAVVLVVAVVGLKLMIKDCVRWFRNQWILRKIK
jgi:hypothetical protein